MMAYDDYPQLIKTLCIEICVEVRSLMVAPEWEW